MHRLFSLGLLGAITCLTTAEAQFRTPVRGTPSRGAVAPPPRLPVAPPAPARFNRPVNPVPVKPVSLPRTRPETVRPIETVRPATRPGQVRPVGGAEMDRPANTTPPRLGQPLPATIRPGQPRNPNGSTRPNIRQSGPAETTTGNPANPPRRDNNDSDRLRQQNAFLRGVLAAQAANQRQQLVREAIRAEVLASQPIPSPAPAPAAPAPIIITVPAPAAEAAPVRPVEREAVEAPVARLPVREKRSLLVRNDTDGKLTIFVQRNEEEKPIRIVLDAGERMAAYDADGEKLVARQVFLWAVSADGTKFDQYKDKALVLADGPYRAEAVEKFTYSFKD